MSHSFALSAIGEFVYAENDYPFTLRNISVVTKERRTNSRMKSGHGEANFIWNINKHNQLDGKLYYYDNDRLLPGQVRYYTNLSNEKLRDQNFLLNLDIELLMVIIFHLNLKLNTIGLHQNIKTDHIVTESRMLTIGKEKFTHQHVFCIHHL